MVNLLRQRDKERERDAEHVLIMNTPVNPFLAKKRPGYCSIVFVSVYYAEFYFIVISRHLNYRYVSKLNRGLNIRRQVLNFDYIN